MSVAKRKTTAGETEEYHYAFSYNGKRYRGVCEGCKTKKEAEDFERKLIATTKKGAEQKTVRALFDNFREELTGGTSIKLTDAYELSIQKPKKRMPSDELIRIKRSYWQDFIAFMQSEYHEIENLNDVRHKHAEAYIQHLRQHGRFNKLITYSGSKITRTRKYMMKGELSAKTINTYQQVLSEVFQLLARDAGIMDNPFTSIPKLGKEEAGREAFSESELMIIRNNADGFIYPLFFFAVATALREGDICTLKWDEIDLKKETIVKKMRKTGNYVEIPMIPPIRDYLQNLQSNIQPDSPYSEYVLPDHARMYLTNSSGVSYRVKQFLEKKCNIATTKIPDARSRAVSVKDLHSCRHTFCYYAGLYGIPLSVVQSIVGHMTPEMTKHYSAHASLEIKREKMKLLPAFLSLAAPESTEPDMTDNSETTPNDLATKIKELPEEIEAELNALVNTIISSDEKRRTQIRQMLNSLTKGK